MILIQHRFVKAIVQGFRSLGPNAAWVTLGTVFTQGSTLLSNITIANLLGKTTFGEFVIVLSTVQAAAAFASFGLAYTITRYMAEFRHTDLRRASALLNLFSRLSWIAAVAAAVVLALCSSGLAGSVLNAPFLGQSLLLAALATVFIIRNGFLIGALSGLEAFKTVGTVGIMSGCLYLSLTAVGASIGGVPGAVVGMCFSHALQCIVLSYALRQEKRRQQFTRVVASFTSERALLFKFALPGSLSALSTVPALYAVQALLTHSPRGFADVAVYGAGLNLQTMVLFVPIMLNGVAMAWINRTQATHGEAAYRSAFRANVGVTLVTVSAALVTVALLGPLLLRLYGRDFTNGYATLALLLLATVPEALTTALNQSLQARERMWEAFFAINVPRDVVIVLVAWSLVPRYGAVGGAAAYLTGRLVAFASMCVLVRHEVRPGSALARVAGTE